MGELRHEGGGAARVILAHEKPFTLGVLKIDPSTRQVEAGHRSETLEPRVMQVLVALARADGAIITRDQLIETCWDGRIVGEDAINRALSRIRQVAADIGGGSFAIETITKVGYRLRADGPAEPGRQVATRSVCVLPFVNMSGDPEQEYFSDGISEDITTDLAKVSALAVTARNTAFQFKGQAVDVCAIAQKLGVTHVLEGSVRKAGNMVRISAQLIDGATGDHVWAERYDRDLTDIFAIQDEISTAVVNALKLKLLPEEREAIEQRATSSVDAYDLYLMARQYWATGNHGDPSREQRVVRICSRALEFDPVYAKAWGLMGLAQANLQLIYDMPSEARPADTAQAALRLDPDNVEAHCVRVEICANEGLFEEAEEHLATALRIEPSSWEVNKEAARLMMFQRRIPEAAAYFEKAASLLDTDFHSWSMLIGCYRHLREVRSMKVAARRVCESARIILSEDPANGAAIGHYVRGLAIKDFARAKAEMERGMLLEGNNAMMRYAFACALANDLGDCKAAIAMVEPALTARGKMGFRLAQADPELDPLRAHPAFVTALAEARLRLGL